MVGLVVGMRGGGARPVEAVTAPNARAGTTLVFQPRRKIPIPRSPSARCPQVPRRGNPAFRPLGRTAQIAGLCPRDCRGRGARDHRRARLNVRAALIAVAMCALWLPSTALAFAPEGIWLMDNRVALQIFRCGDLLCGRVAWLQVPLNAAGFPDQDRKNPDPALRSRPLCGLTVLRGLRTAGVNRWKGGILYNPDDGKSYDVTAELNSPDKMTARIFIGIPLLGKTKELVRLPPSNWGGAC